MVWDLGCNTGRFSKLAAASADCVVALDSDHESIERLYLELRERAVRNLLPLVVDLADPSPSLGWRGRERRSLVERGRPDLVLSLALVHHLAIAANIPLADLVEWFAELGADLVVEFPAPDRRDGAPLVAAPWHGSRRVQRGGVRAMSCQPV